MFRTCPPRQTHIESCELPVLIARGECADAPACDSPRNSDYASGPTRQGGGTAPPPSHLPVRLDAESSLAALGGIAGIRVPEKVPVAPTGAVVAQNSPAAHGGAASVMVPGAGAAQAVAQAVRSISQWRPRPSPTNANAAGDAPHVNAAPGQKLLRGTPAEVEQVGARPTPASPSSLQRYLSRAASPQVRATPEGKPRPAASAAVPVRAHSPQPQRRAAHQQPPAATQGDVSGRVPLRRAAREPHTLGDPVAIPGDEAIGGGTGGTTAGGSGAVRAEGNAAMSAGGSAPPVLYASQQQQQQPPRSAHTKQLPLAGGPPCAATAATAHAVDLQPPRAALSPVNEWERKYLGGEVEVGSPGPSGARGADWESPRMGPPLPTRFSPHVSRSASLDPSAGGDVGNGRGRSEAEIWVPPSPLVRAKDNLMNSFAALTPTRLPSGAAEAPAALEASPQPRFGPPAPLPIWGEGRPADSEHVGGFGEGGAGPWDLSAPWGRVEEEAKDVGGDVGGLVGRVHGDMAALRSGRWRVRLARGEVVEIGEETYDLSKPYRAGCLTVSRASV